MGLVESCGNDCSEMVNCSDKKNDSRWKKKVVDEYKRPATETQTETETQTAVPKLEKNQSINEENAKLLKMLTEMSEKMEAQKTQNDILKNELEALQTSTDNEEKLIEDEDGPETVVELLPTLDSHKQKSAEEIKADINHQASEHRINETLFKAETLTVTDVKTMIMHRYKTEMMLRDSGPAQGMVDDENDTDTDTVDDDCLSTDSSMDPSEKEEIQHRKRETLQAEEIAAMKKELNTMEKQATFGDIFDDDIINEEGAGNEEDGILRDSQTNLFRFESEHDWNRDALITQKKEMQAHLAHLVESHVSKSKSPINNILPHSDAEN